MVQDSSIYSIFLLFAYWENLLQWPQLQQHMACCSWCMESISTFHTVGWSENCHRISQVFPNAPNQDDAKLWIFRSQLGEIYSSIQNMSPKLVKHGIGNRVRCQHLYNIYIAIYVYMCISTIYKSYMQNYQAEISSRLGRISYHCKISFYIQ